MHKLIQHHTKVTIQKGRKYNINGFSMSELVVSLSAGALIVTSSGVALQSTQKLVNQQTEKTSLRQNTLNGLRIMRSEIERSTHLVLQRSEPVEEGMEHTNLGDNKYDWIVGQCKNLSDNFIPIVGTKMRELTEPVLYGLNISPTSNKYSLLRCGAPLDSNNSNQEFQDIAVTPILKNIGKIPCPTELEPQNQCPSTTSITDQNLDFKFTGGKTPIRKIHEPALRIETDINSKLVKFIDPTVEGDDVTESFVRKLDSQNQTLTTVPTYFAAFARADKRINLNGKDGNGGILSGAFFKNVRSNRLRFVVDGSGSMSACVMWGEGYGDRRTYYDPNQSKYISRSRNCAFTRMEAMQSELTGILTDLPDETKIGLQAFSTSGRANNKGWQPSEQRLVTISEPEMRDSAIAFVNTLDDPYPTEWGGTKPWDAIQKAFDDEEVNTLYLLSDGKPNRDIDGGYWSSKDHDDTANYYAEQNKNRVIKLEVNSTSLGLNSPWMEKLSELTSGEYNQIDKNTLIEDSEEDT